MSLKTHLSVWMFVFLLTLLQINQGSGFLWSRRRRLNRRPTPKPTAVINCGSSAWSAWSECTPFCHYHPKTNRTRRVRKGNKCETEIQERYCDARGGCSHRCDSVKKKCFCSSGYNLVGGKSCVDIDECNSNEGRGPCSHRCQNMPGRYICNCNKGYRVNGRTACTLLDCSTPQFSSCPQKQTTANAEGNLPLCTSIKTSCQNGTTYNSQCTLSCPKNYKLTLKKSTTTWPDYIGFEFQTASSMIICHESSLGTAIWHTRLKEYHCRRSNDPPLAIKLAGGSIKEGLPPGSIVGRLSTSDAQKGQIMVYSVQNYEGKSLFRCNGSVLETSMVFTWYPHGQNLYPVRIRAQDNGSPPMWREDVFNISVENVNDPPRSIEISRNWVNENASVGTVVGELSAIDDDLGNQRTSNFSWKLLEDNSGNFNITGNMVVLQKTLNYDTIKLCYIKVACADQYLTTVKEIPIYVINLIDPPTLSLKGNSIAENSKPGTVITQITSKSESNESLYFTISESNPNATLKFGLGSSTVCKHHKNATKFNTTCYVNITVSGKLDYEETGQYTLQVYVRNSVSSNFVKWNISVENVNEKPDKLEINVMHEIPEDTKSGIDIAFFVVSDPDNRNVISQNHSCYVVNNAGEGEYFHVNNVRNSLQVKKNMSLNYEIHQSYLVTVQCNDNGVPSLGIRRDFIINVTDTDEPIQNLTLSNNTVKENSKIGARVGTFDAYDPDIHRPKTMKFSLVDPKYPPFILQGVNNEELVVNGSLNFEENSDYILTIRVTDTAGRYLQMPFIITIIDVDEKPTGITLYTNYMNENLAPGSFISNITMIDEDENTMTICRLLEDGEGRIALNETTLVAGEHNTDYEQVLSHVIEISLKCCDQLEKCFRKEFNISVQDVNEPPTDINIDNLQVMENEKDITIGKITIFDPDSNPDYHCTLSADNQTNSYLKIINSNKTLHLIKELNFEKEQMVTFEIICREKGNSSMYYRKQFDLTIVDLNEAPNRGCERPLYVSEEQSFGTVVGNLNVSDPDNTNTKDICNPKQTLNYTIISEKNLPFKILDGYLVKTGHFESNATYIIGVSVEDDGIILARNFSRLRVKRQTTLFNCTIISRPLIGSQITLSSNQIKEGSPNASIIGYLGMEGEQHNMKYELMKDRCNSYPFVIEGNKLMLMLSSYTGPRTNEEYTVPQYAIVMVKANGTNATSSGHVMDTRFAIFINDDVKTHRLICFSNDPVRLSDITKTKLGPVIIYQDNDTKLTCLSENKPYPPPDYRCDVKPDMNQSSEAFTRVNFTNALYVDNEMFLRVNISISEEVSGLDKLVLDLFCWDPDRFFSFVKGRIEILLTHEAVCKEDHQPRNDRLCSNTKSCPEDTLCSRVINVGQRCVPSDDQLFVVIPLFREEGLLCKFESCLQEMLVNPKTGCLSDWNERRQKRATDYSLYLDTLNITVLRERNKFLLRAAVWEIQDGGQLRLVPKQSLPQLQDRDDIIFITTKEECNLLKNQGIKCPAEDSGSKSGTRFSTPLESPKIQAAVGAGVAILLIIIIIVIVYCLRKRRKQNKQVKRKATVGDFANMAFDDSELKELPPIPKKERKDNTLDTKKKEKKGKLKYHFKNPVYEEPAEIQSGENNESHIYNEAHPPVATYEEPQQLVEKSHDKTKSTKAISNPFYEATDVIPVQKPQDNSAGNYANVNYLNEKTSTATKEPEYETLPHLQDKEADKKGLFRFSKNVNKNKKRNSKQEFDQNNKTIQTHADYALNKDKQQDGVKSKQQCTTATNDPHYEELPLPDENQINKWKQQSDQPNNEGLPSKDNTKSQVINVDQALNTKIPDEKENKREVSKDSTYEDIPPIKDEKKRKGIFRFSKAFKNNDLDSKQENKTDRKDSTNSDKFSSQNEMLNPRQSMLNPREKVKKDDPANKYPFYEELPPVRDPKRTESFFAVQQGNQKDSNSSSPYYHVLETNAQGAECGNQDTENNEDGPHYFIIEKSNSTSTENKQYQSLHRELEPPSPAYETYRLPQKSGPESGSRANEGVNGE